MSAFKMDKAPPFCLILMDIIKACHEFDSFSTTANPYNANNLTSQIQGVFISVGGTVFAYLNLHTLHQNI